MSSMPKELITLLNENFNIVGTIKIMDVDHNFDLLKEFFISTKKEVFEYNDRYVIEHQDTDIYIPEMSVGVNLRNFFHIVNELDIPLFTILIWTNHFGIQREIDILCKNDKPTILESFCDILHVSNNYKNIPLSPESIKHHALSMMGATRSHRFALYNELKNEDPNKVALSIKGIK